MVNGTPLEPFVSTKGIRKNNPISFFLFILKVEGHNIFVKHEGYGGYLSEDVIWILV